MGLPVRVAVILIYLAAIALGAGGYAISRLEETPSYVVAGTVALIGGVVAHLLSHVDVYADDTATRRADRNDD